MRIVAARRVGIRLARGVAIHPTSCHRSGVGCHLVWRHDHDGEKEGEDLQREGEGRVFVQRLTIEQVCPRIVPVARIKMHVVGFDLANIGAATRERHVVLHLFFRVQPRELSPRGREAVVAK